MSSWILENKKLCLKINNDKGGVSIRSLYDKENNYEWVHTQKNGLSSEGLYDSVYDGGFEFIFPTDVPCRINGMNYQDHGFLWTTLFETKGIEKTETGQRITFTGKIHEIGVNVTIDFSLNNSSREIHSSITLENLNNFNIPYLFRFHPSILLHETSRLDLNGTDIIFEFDGNAVKACDFKEIKEASFPNIRTERGKVDLENLCRCNLKEVFCHIKQKTGSFGIEDKTGKMRIKYDHCKLPILTLYFFNNDHKVVILEPATSAISDVSELPDKKNGVRLKDKDTYAFDFTIV